MATETHSLPQNVVAAAADDYVQPRYTRRETVLTMIGVLLVMLLASMDQTIVSTAEPHIIADLQGFNHYTWVATAYLLASTVVVPIWGKVSDIFGRKPIFLIGVIVFLVGSALCGAAQSMTQLIFFRAFQGLGAAALMPIAISIVGDLFTPRERGKWQGLTGAVWGFSAIVGPTAGGWITENATWRWVFYVNVPIGIVALLVLIFLMPTLYSGQKARIDYIGAALLVLSALPLLLGFTWAGSVYPWASWQTVALFAGAVVVGTLFVLYELHLERSGGEPIIAPSLFLNSIFTVSAIVTIIFGLALFGSVYFIPLFVQGVVGTSATNSGVILTPLTLTSMASSVIAGFLVSRFGKYKWVCMLGMIVSVGGALLLVRLNAGSTNLDVLMALLVLGFGMGFSMSVYTLIVQNAMPQRIGQATSSLVFFRSIGSTMGLAAMGSLMTSSFQPAFYNFLSPSLRTVVNALPAQAQTALGNPQVLLSAQVQQQLRDGFTQPRAGVDPAVGLQMYHSLLEAVKQGLAQSLHNIFLFNTVMIAIAFIAVFFLKEIKLRDRKGESASIASDIAEQSIEQMAQEGVSTASVR